VKIISKIEENTKVLEVFRGDTVSTETCGELTLMRYSELSGKHCKLLGVSHQIAE
jgi:hypothetical protein